MKTVRRYAWLVVTGLLLSGCAAVSPLSPTFLNSNSPISRNEAALYRFILIEAVFFFVIIIGALLWILIRYRSQGDNTALPPQIHASKLTWGLYKSVSRNATKRPAAA